MKQLGFIGIALCLTIPALGQPAGAATPELLPPFNVTGKNGLPRPESWRYASTPGFEVLSNARDSRTHRLLDDFEKFNRAIAVVWPALQERMRAGEVPIVLCGGHDSFNEFAAAGSAGAEASQGMASLFLQSGERSAIVVNVENTIINLQTPSDVAATGDATDDSGQMLNGTRIDLVRQFRRAYVHFLLSRFDPRPPPWLEEGLAQLLMGIKFDAKHIELAALEDPTSVSPEQRMNIVQSELGARSAGRPRPGVPRARSSAPQAGVGGSGVAIAPNEEGDFSRNLRDRALMDFSEMFAVERDSPTARSPIGSTWANQCYAFVHMCLYGRGQIYNAAFIQFVTRLSTEPPSESLFEECFGKNYDEMGVELRGYVGVTDYKKIEMNARDPSWLSDVGPLALRDATQADIGRIKGKVLLMTSQPDKAGRELTVAYARGERDPRLIAELGLFEKLQGNDSFALGLLESAAASKVSDPRLYLELARLRLAHFQPKPAGPEFHLSAAQSSDVLALLFTARSQPPSMPDVYETMADTWRLGEGKVTRENLAVLEEGVRAFPRQVNLVYKTALLEADAGETENVAGLVDLGDKITVPGSLERVRFDQLVR